MKGASRILAAATGARFVCSAAFQRDEFKEFIGASRDLNMRTRESTGVEEFAKIMQILLSRREAGARKETVGPEWARADYILYRRPATNDAPACEVVALSPSSATLSRGLHEIASLLPKLGESRRAAVSVEPNETSLVLCVRFGNALCLLGADLENGSGSNVGWEAVLKTVALPAERVHVFKVPHHGSENAYHSGVWTGALLPQDPIAIVTPFARGRKTLPAPEDLARMKQHTKRLYCTSPRAPRATLGDPMVERTIREVARDFRPRAGRMGQVRVRLNAATATPTIELFGAAFPA
jgi:hypothetical protein